MTLGIVYKIHSLNKAITEIYVGSTKDFAKRESSHKHATTNPESDNYSRRVYEYIRANGGWEHFQMDQIETMEFEDVRELRIREGYWIRELKASLNCCIPGRTDAEWRAENLEHIAEIGKQYRAANQEIIRAKKHEYAKAHSSEIVEKVRQLRLKDPEATKIKRHKEYEKYKDRMAALSKQDRLSNPEKHKARSLKYRTEHAEELRAKKAEIVICECGTQSTRGTLPRHRLTARHAALLAAKNIPPSDIVPAEPESEDATHNSAPPVQLS